MTASSYHQNCFDIVIVGKGLIEIGIVLVQKSIKQYIQSCLNYIYKLLRLLMWLTFCLPKTKYSCFKTHFLEVQGFSTLLGNCYYDVCTDKRVIFNFILHSPKYNSSQLVRLSRLSFWIPLQKLKIQSWE